MSNPETFSQAKTPRTKQVDIVVPLYNEEDLVAKFHQRLLNVLEGLAYRFTICYVNDGSTDGTQEQLDELLQNSQDSGRQDLARQDMGRDNLARQNLARTPRIRIIELSRNFGHQAALSAGLDLAAGDYVITMDGDGEHPPEMIPEMLALAEDGFEIVLTQRKESQKASRFKRWTSQSFYKTINAIGSTNILPGAADFRLLDRIAIDALAKMGEYHRFLRGMIPWMGFRTAILPYKPDNRMGGSSKYSVRKMLNLALNAVFSFSLVPLYIAISLGGIFLVLALIEAIYVLSFWFSGQQSSLAPGWSSLMFVLLVIGGVIMITLGMIGIYIGYIFQEVKRRPVYLVRSVQPNPAPQTPEANPEPDEAAVE